MKPGHGPEIRYSMLRDAFRSLGWRGQIGRDVLSLNVVD